MLAAALQMPHGDTLAANVARAHEMTDAARAAGAQLALLPEYWFATPGGGPLQERDGPDIRKALGAMSRGLVLGANVVERREGKLLNVGVVYADGHLALDQPKVHPMPREVGAGVASWPHLEARDVAGFRVGMLVCADVLYPEAARVLALQGARVLLNPVMSPFRENDPGKAAREAVYVARAYDSGAFVVKAGGFRAGAIAGRSLIAAPWGLLARYQDDFAEELVLAELDFARLDAFRESQAKFPARVPEAYGRLVE